MVAITPAAQKNIERRLWQHKNGEGANYTKKRLPVKLVYAESFDRVEDAFRREKQVQGWSRRKKKALIEENYDKLIEFSRNYIVGCIAYVFSSFKTSTGFVYCILACGLVSRGHCTIR